MDIKHGSSSVEERPVIDVEEHAGDSGGGQGDLRCPLCGWTPGAEDRWICKCDHSWNTFDTGGVCPNCLYQWAYTQCMACLGWSPHSDWYGKR